MAIFGFVCGFVILAFITFAWVFTSVYDGAFGGKRDIPVIWMLFILCLIGYGWYLLFTNAPFTLSVQV